MKIYLFLLLYISFAITSYADEYVGQIGTQPISASITDVTPKDVIQHQLLLVYMYDKYRTPIRIINSTDPYEVVFKEYNGKNPIGEFHLKLNEVFYEGYWLNIKSGQKLPVKLIPKYDERGKIQSNSFKDSYVRVDCNDYHKVINFIDKKNDSTINSITTTGDCFPDDFKIDDFNFDGYSDFSFIKLVKYAPNILNDYYIYNPSTKKYEKSEQLKLFSLHFNPKDKTITSDLIYYVKKIEDYYYINDIYKWENGKLKLIESKCLAPNGEGNLLSTPREKCPLAKPPFKFQH